MKQHSEIEKESEFKSATSLESVERIENLYLTPTEIRLKIYYEAELRGMKIYEEA